MSGEYAALEARIDVIDERSILQRDAIKDVVDELRGIRSDLKQFDAGLSSLKVTVKSAVGAVAIAFTFLCGIGIWGFFTVPDQIADRVATAVTAALNRQPANNTLENGGGEAPPHQDRRP